MNTNFDQSFVPSAGNSAKYTFFRKPSRAKLPTSLYGTAALVCGLFFAVAPTRAQSVTPFTYLSELYSWWITNNDSLTHKTIAVRATFVGGSAHPAKGGGVSMGIFQGYITSDGSSKFGSFALPG
jgi:hypothetical protein